MRFRPRALVAIPLTLQATRSKAARERAKAHAHYTKQPPPTDNYKFKVYRDEAIKAALNDLFGKKCAYCEGMMEALISMNVEHFRPKGEVEDAQGVRRFPGYWWLASDWSNLLPACDHCNTIHNHRVNGVRVAMGKGSRFPLANAGQNALIVGAEAAEHPLLIDPSGEDPSLFIRFECLVGQGRMGFASLAKPKMTPGGSEQPKGVASIDVYALNRPGLIEQRGRRIKNLAFNLESIEERWSSARAYLPSELAIRSIQRCRLDLRELISEFLNWEAPYAEACKNYFDEWKKLRKQRSVGVTV